jgi:hypothetical protein
MLIDHQTSMLERVVKALFTTSEEDGQNGASQAPSARPCSRSPCSTRSPPAWPTTPAAPRQSRPCHSRRPHAAPALAAAFGTIFWIAAALIAALLLPRPPAQRSS